MLRAIAFALSLALCSTPVFALERDDLIGDWNTQWASAAGQEPWDGGLVRISADNMPEGLDGLLPSPGWDGLMSGDVSEENGAVVWSGRWASVWSEGATMGTFRLVFTSPESFTGVWSSDDAAVVDAAWIGQRVR